MWIVDAHMQLLKATKKILKVSHSEDIKTKLSIQTTFGNKRG
jgi:hypothetical protein